jgi:TctA family transporter
VFLTRPISAALIVVTVAVLVVPPLIGWARRRQRAR